MAISSRRFHGEHRYIGVRLRLRRYRRLLHDWHGDKAECPECRAKLTLENSSLDHIVPLCEGGAVLDPENLRLMCRDCNSSKEGKAEKARWRAREQAIIDAHIREFGRTGRNWQKPCVREIWMGEKMTRRNKRRGLIVRLGDVVEMPRLEGEGEK